MCRRLCRPIIFESYCMLLLSRMARVFFFFLVVVLHHKHEKCSTTSTIYFRQPRVARKHQDINTSAKDRTEKQNRLKSRFFSLVCGLSELSSYWPIWLKMVKNWAFATSIDIAELSDVIVRDSISHSRNYCECSCSTMKFIVSSHLSIFSAYTNEI